MGLDGFLIISWLELWNRKIIHVTPSSERRKAFWGTGKQPGEGEKYREVVSNDSEKKDSGKYFEEYLWPNGKTICLPEVPSNFNHSVIICFTQWEKETL